MADVIMQLTQFQTPRKNFSIFNFTRFVGENMNKTASWSVTIKKMQPFEHCLNYSSDFLLNSGIPLFTSRESSRHECNRTAILRQHSRQRTDASVSTSKGTPSWMKPRLALHKSFNVLNAITTSLLRGKALQCKRGPCFLEVISVFCSGRFRQV